MSETDLTTIPNIGPTKAAALKAAGFETVDDVKEASIEDLCVVDGIARLHLYAHDGPNSLNPLTAWRHYVGEARSAKKGVRKMRDYHENDD